MASHIIPNYDYIFYHFSCFLTAFVNFGFYIDNLDTATAIFLVKRLIPSLKNHSLKNLRVHKLSAKDQALYWKVIHLLHPLSFFVEERLVNRTANEKQPVDRQVERSDLCDFRRRAQTL